MGVGDVLSCNEGAEPAVGLSDNTSDAPVFATEPNYLHVVVEYLTTTTFPPNMPKEARKRLAHKAILYLVVDGCL